MAEILKFPERIDPRSKDIIEAIWDINQVALTKAVELLSKHDPEKLKADLNANLEHVAMGARLLLDEAATRVIDPKLGLSAFLKKNA